LEWLSCSLTAGAGGNNRLVVVAPGAFVYQIVNYAWAAGVEYVFLNDRVDDLQVAPANARVMFNTWTGQAFRSMYIWFEDNAGAGSAWNIRGRYSTLD